MNTKIIAVAALIIVTVFAAMFLFTRNSHSVGNIAPTDITATNNTESTASVGMQTPVFQLGGVTAASSITQQVSVGSCAGTGTSTLFAVANPFAATTTATMISISGVATATTTSLVVGTSSKSTGLASTDVSASFVNASVATSAVFYFTPGAKTGPAGYLSPGAGTVQTIVVGPSDNIVGFATTTATGVGAAGFSPSYTSCTYKILWNN